METKPGNFDLSVIDAVQTAIEQLEANGAPLPWYTLKDHERAWWVGPYGEYEDDGRTPQWGIAVSTLECEPNETVLAKFANTLPDLLVTLVGLRDRVVELENAGGYDAVKLQSIIGQQALEIRRLNDRLEATKSWLDKATYAINR